MATAQQIRDLITQTIAGSVHLRVPCEVRDEVCRHEPLAIWWERKDVS